MLVNIYDFILKPPYASFIMRAQDVIQFLISSDKMKRVVKTLFLCVAVSESGQGERVGISQGVSLKRAVFKCPTLNIASKKFNHRRRN